MIRDTNNSPMESFNGNTVTLWEEATSGLKKDDSPTLPSIERGLSICALAFDKYFRNASSIGTGVLKWRMSLPKKSVPR